MHSFGPLLKKAILDRGYTVNQFAKKLEFNRGTLYSVFSGSKNLPEDIFHRALTFLPGPEQTQLLQAYYADIYGRTTMEHILFLQQTLNRMADRESAAAPNAAAGSGALVPPLKEFFARAAKDELPDIYTNYSFRATAIDDAVYEVLTGGEEAVRLHHYVLTETGGSGTGNLHALFSSLRYINLKQNVSMLPVSDPQLPESHALFPFFFVTTGQLLLLTRDGSGFLFSDDPAVVDSVFQKALRRFMEAKPLAQFLSPTFDYRSVMELMEMALPAKGHHICIESQMCLAKSLSDPEFLDAIAVPQLPLRSSLIRLVAHHYRDLCDRTFPTIYSSSGCLRFLETGIVEDLPQNLVSPVPPPFRRQALILQQQACADGTTDAILNESKLRLPQKIAFILNDTHHTVTITSTDYAWRISVVDPHLRDDFFHFLDYCRRGQLLLSGEEAVAFLQHLIAVFDENESGLSRDAAPLP